MLKSEGVLHFQMKENLPNLFNPFPPSVPIWHRLAKLAILILESFIKKFPMIVETMNR